MCIQYSTEEFPGSLLVRDIRVSELLSASGVNVWINGSRSARVKLHRSSRHNFVAHEGPAPVGSDEAVQHKYGRRARVPKLI